jgi:DNA-directed RNA polymerase subunit RPC12/RpoP
MITNNEPAGHIRVYYEKKGAEAHDYVLRCHDCKKLILHSDIVHRGGCPKCGNRRVEEVRGLTLLEWLRIKVGLLRFKHSDLFMAEFSPKGWWNRG